MKNFIENFLYIIVCFAVVFGIVFVYGEITDRQEQKLDEKKVEIKKIPIKHKYLITYKDGTTYTVCANSYIWNNGKIRFYVADTIVVNETPSSIVENVDIK